MTKRRRAKRWNRPKSRSFEGTITRQMREKQNLMEFHERELIRRLTDKLSRATSPLKRQRYALRVRAAKARLMAIVLAK